MRLNPFRKPQPPHRYAAQQVAVSALPETVKQLSAKIDEWQRKVLTYAALVPEVMTGYLFVHNTMDRLTFNIERFDRIEQTWVRDTDPAMRGIERKINTAFSAGRAMALQHLVEETYILVRRDAQNRFEFETLGPTEIRTTSNGKAEKRVLVNGEKDEWAQIDADVTIIRAYTPDPSDRNRASGPHKPLLGLLELMALELTSEQSEAINVLAGNGILYIPTEVLPDETDDLDVPATPGSRRHFEDRLEEGMVSVITDRSRGEAVVPLVVYGPAEYANAIVHILPKRQSTAGENSARMDSYISRYAHAIDLPDQVILGTGDSNHWSDWKVDENTWAYHLYPRAQRLADALYAGVVAKVIRNLDRDPDEYRLVPDATKAIAKQDLSRTAIDAYKLGAITPESFVEAIGFDPSDMRVDAEEALLALVNRESTDIQPLDPSRPDRVAASKNPRVILRQASKVANAHEAKLRKIYQRFLTRIADDAAADGRREDALKPKAEKVAAGQVPFVPFDKSLGYEPVKYFARYQAELIESTADELFAYLKRIASLTGFAYNDVRQVWAGEFEQRARAVSIEAEKAASSISRRSFDASKPARVTDATIRTLTTTANGGSTQDAGSANNTSRPTHAGEDPVMSDILGDAVGRYATQYTWVYGDPGTRQHPYPEHEELAGRSWFAWEEFDALDTGGSNDVVDGSVFYPGDHPGCQCEYQIDFVQVPAGE